MAGGGEDDVLYPSDENSPLKLRERRISLELGRRLRALREHRGLVRKQVGQLVELSPQQIANYENGEHRLPVAKMVIIAHRLGADVDYFLNGLIEGQALVAETEQARYGDMVGSGTPRQRLDCALAQLTDPAEQAQVVFIFERIVELVRKQRS